MIGFHVGGKRIARRGEFKRPLGDKDRRSRREIEGASYRIKYLAMTRTHHAMGLL